MPFQRRDWIFVTFLVTALIIFAVLLLDPREPPTAQEKRAAIHHMVRAKPLPPGSLDIKVPRQPTEAVTPMEKPYDAYMALEQISHRFHVMFSTPGNNDLYPWYGNSRLRFTDDNGVDYELAVFYQESMATIDAKALGNKYDALAAGYCLVLTPKGTGPTAITRYIQRIC